MTERDGSLYLGTVSCGDGTMAYMRFGTGARPFVLLPRASLYLYEGYSHAVYDEAPDFKARVLRFLAGEATGEAV